VTRRDDTFAALVQEHGAMVARIARSYEADPGRAEDLAQDIYLALWQALPRFKAGAALRTYIARIAHNRAISHVGREVRRPLAFDLDEDLPSGGPSPEDLAVESDARRKLEEAVRRLPIGQRVVATLALEGFMPEEVASVLGITPAAASVRLHRAQTQLRDWFKGEGR
jgi:RNA polymerase sigma-70 factor (ECF subfamily)